ncbi:MAG: hypothetical protein A3F16_06290 [Deltaproteobacteria bacterium RIFCSPHIGHO2_12_FULL_43_9]|nr:MAG: hypothetical protein A3F16_06290 [Deltaproteobacteria bacterium RIFCSPHIGHO2_12_FULL_43_9]
MLQNQIKNTLLIIGKTLSQLELPYCIVGALAVAVWGEPRATRDLDILILLTSEDRGNLLSKLTKFGFKIDTAWELQNPMIRQFQTRLLDENKIILDLLEPRDTFQEEVIHNSVKQVIFGVEFKLPTAENLILMKLKAGRPRDFEDALSILVRQDKLNESYLLEKANKLGILEEMQFVLEKQKMTLNV